MPPDARLRQILLPALLIAMAFVAVAACDSKAPSPSGPTNGHPATLSGTAWVVTAIGGATVPPDTQPTMSFNATTVRGSGGCNGFGGHYQYDPTTGELRFESVAMTQMACPGAARNQVEAALIGALAPPSFVVTIQPDGHLVFASAAGTRLDLVEVGPTVTD